MYGTFTCHLQAIWWSFGGHAAIVIMSSITFMNVWNIYMSFMYETITCHLQVIWWSFGGHAAIVIMSSITFMNVWNIYMSFTSQLVVIWWSRCYCYHELYHVYECMEHLHVIYKPFGGHLVVTLLLLS